VALWLLVVQRLHGGSSLETAVIELLRGLPASFWPRPCKRIRDWREHGKTPSSNTGAYNQARQSLPLSFVQKAATTFFNGWLPNMANRPTAPAASSFWMGRPSAPPIARNCAARIRRDRIRMENRTGPYSVSW